jgi:suppressor of ftsI
MPATTRRSFMTKTATLAALAPVLASTAKTASAEVGGRKLVLETRDMDMVVDGITCRVRAYNGQVPGPPIRTRPGEKMTITLKNGLAPVSSEGWNGDHNVPHGLGDTNLHFHGLDVRPHLFEPLGTLDPLAKMIAIKPGDSLDYPLEIPLDHPPGLYWYHPHKHGATAVQAASGMAGPIIISGPIDEVPEIKAAKEILLVVQDLGLFPDDGHSWSYSPQQNAMWQTFAQEEVTIYDPYTGKPNPQPQLRQGFTTGDYARRYFLLNGKPFFLETHDPANAKCPPVAKGKQPAQCPIGKQLPVERYELVPGQVVRFRMLNGCTDNMMPITVDGHDMHLLAMDGRNFPRVQTIPKSTSSQVTLAPANRAEFLIKAGKPGKYAIRQLPQNEQFLYSDGKVIAEIVVKDAPPVDMKLPTDLPVISRYYPLIRPEQVKRRRNFVLTEAFPAVLNPYVGGDFLINNMQYGEQEVPTVVRIGDVEEWNLSVPDNGGSEGHPFHIHVNGFEVISIGGVAQPPGLILDTVWLPAGKPVVVRTVFKEFAGKAVYHCHILPHEDTGMMQNFLILPEGGHHHG